jgi:hypothetical protein
MVIRVFVYSADFRANCVTRNFESVLSVGFRVIDENPCIPLDRLACTDRGVSSPMTHRASLPLLVVLGVSSPTTQTYARINATTVFCPSRISAHFLSSVVDEGDQIQRSTKRLMWHWATDVQMDQIERTRFSRRTCRMCGRNLLAVLAVLAELMVGEGELGNVAGLG